MTTRVLGEMKMKLSRPGEERAGNCFMDERERTLNMGNPVFAEGSRVRVVSYSPFRGLKGTIRIVHRIAPLDEPFCFYQIELEGAHVKEPIWFAYEEVELLASHEGLLLTSDTKSA